MPDSLAAFPGAEGFGAGTVGGRGGAVIEVTNLNDSGAGSFRACAEASRPRTCIFRIAGWIVLDSPVWVSSPYLTVAGQSAPGRVGLRNDPGNRGSSLVVKTHDVVIRYLTIRPGPSAAASGNVDALTISDIDMDNSTYNVIVDHCSLSWATDEVLNTWYAAHDITIQWSIISEGLRNSTHEKGPHSMGALLGSDGAHSMSFHHNLLAHNVARNGRVKISGIADLVNNVIYNAEYPASAVTDNYGAGRVNWVGNYFRAGPDTMADSRTIAAWAEGGHGFELYVQGNIGPHRPTDDLPETDCMEYEAQGYVVTTCHDAPAVTTLSAFDAFDAVLDGAGATVYLNGEGQQVWARDAVDERIVADVRNGTGTIIDDPSQVGGWPEIAAAAPPADSDRDGMPDEWEEAQGLDALDPSDGSADADRDGYTNLEEYLNGTEAASAARGSVMRTAAFVLGGVAIVVVGYFALKALNKYWGDENV